jgi:hypothetical protein
VFHLCFHCFGRHPLMVWLPPPFVVPSHQRCLWRFIVAGVGLRRKPLPVCRPMMATPSGAIFLLGSIVRLPLPPP